MAEEFKYDNDEISLAELLQKVFDFFSQYGRPILLGTFVVTTMGAALSWVDPKYESQAILRTPGLSLTSWRAAEILLNDPQWREGLIQEKLGPEAAATVIRVIDKNPSTDKRIEFRVAHTRQDKKDFPEAIGKDFNALGLMIKGYGSTETEAFKAVDTSKDLIRETLLWITLRDWIQSAALASQRSDAEFERSLLENQLALEKTEARIREMRQVVSLYPDVRRLENNTVVSVQEGGARYLSPLAQLVALETTLQDIREQRRLALRKKEQIELEKAFFSKMQTSLSAKKSGSSIADQAQALLTELYASLNTKTPATREKFIDLSLRVTQAKQRFLEEFDYLQLPSEPVTSKERQLTRVLPIALFAGFFVLVIIFASYHFVRSVRLNRVA